METIRTSVAGARYDRGTRTLACVKTAPQCITSIYKAKPQGLFGVTPGRRISYSMHQAAGDESAAYL